MAIDSTHPEYDARIDDWLKMRHCYEGERAVKEQETTYLPATGGMLLDGMGSGEQGRANYDSYIARACFPSYTEDAVRDLVGAMHAKPAMIELPKAMEPMLESATIKGESLQLLLRRINEAQLMTGRIGLLLDLPTEGNAPLPYIALYDAEKIINWDDGSIGAPTLQTLNLVVLDESEAIRNDDLEWEEVERYRLLTLGDVTANESDGIYRQALYVVDYETVSGKEQRNIPKVVDGKLIEPQISGNRLEEIPFIFINATDLLPCPMKPPLLALADLCLSIYRNSADHEQGLYMQSQDTLVVKGGADDAVYRVGAGATINVPNDGDAKYIGVTSDGLSEQRENIQAKHRQAKEMAGQLVDTTSRQKESGEALRVRVAAQTVTLYQVALAGAEGLQSLLRIAAQWIGANPEEVIVTPNLEFAEPAMTATDFLQLMQAKEKGLPLADEDIHELLKKNKLTVKDFEDVMSLLADERGRLLDLPTNTFRKDAA